MVWIMHVVNGKRSLINFVFAALQLAGLSITSLALPLSLVEPHSSLKWSQVNAERIKFVTRRPLHPIVQVCALAFFIFFFGCQLRRRIRFRFWVDIFRSISRMGTFVVWLKHCADCWHSDSLGSLLCVRCATRFHWRKTCDGLTTRYITHCRRFVCTIFVTHKNDFMFHEATSTTTKTSACRTVDFFCPHFSSLATDYHTTWERE